VWSAARIGAARGFVGIAGAGGGALRHRRSCPQALAAASGARQGRQSRARAGQCSLNFGHGAAHPAAGMSAAAAAVGCPRPFLLRASAALEQPELLRCGITAACGRGLTLRSSADPLRRPPSGRSRPSCKLSFRGQPASASTVGLAQTLGSTKPTLLDRLPVIHTMYACDSSGIPSRRRQTPGSTRSPSRGGQDGLL